MELKSKDINLKVAIIVLAICWIIAAFTFQSDKDIAIGLLIIGAAMAIYISTSSNDIFNPLGTYTLFWLASAGLANFRLSYDQLQWSWYNYLIVFTAYLSFVVGYVIILKRSGNKTLIKEKTVDVKKLRTAIVLFFSVSILAFLAEVALLRFIPLFSDRMDAYQAFHVSGLHYFVVAISLIPSMNMIYKKMGGKKKTWLLNSVAFLIPVLIVSRQLLLLELLTILITYNYCYKRFSLKKIFIIGIITIAAFTATISLRNQSIDYINSVSNIKPQYKSSLTQFYMYVSMNFENLRNIANNHTELKVGQSTLFPVFAFTNTKKYINYDYKSGFYTNVLFNTSTYLSDVYFDYGYIGVIIVPFLLGILYSYIYNYHIKTNRNKFTIAIYAVLEFSLIFCFFVPWYFNPTIWFYLIVLLLIKGYSEGKLKWADFVILPLERMIQSISRRQLVFNTLNQIKRYKILAKIMEITIALVENLIKKLETLLEFMKSKTV